MKKLRLRNVECDSDKSISKTLLVTSAIFLSPAKWAYNKLNTF